MTTPLKFPFYAKVTLLLVGLYVLISMLSITQGIILPVIYATLIAILISPVINFLVRKKINRVVAIAGVLILALLFTATVIALFLSQVSMLSEAMPQLTEKFQQLIDQCVTFVSANLNISEQKIDAWIANIKGDLVKNSSSLIGNTLSTMGSALAVTFLTPVYIFMILYYKPHLVRFIHELFGSNNDSNVNEILVETKTIIQSYLVGLFAECAIIAVLNSAGLLLLGIQYAILLGIVGALLNIIPYIGGLIGMALFAIVALLTKSPVYVLYVLALYTFIQLIDNNYIVPKIVGSKVKLNAFVSILAVLAGGALWGVPGMLLSIPITAVIKLILDRTENLKPWGFLMGDTMPPLVKIKVNIKEMAKKLPQAASTFSRKQSAKRNVL